MLSLRARMRETPHAPPPPLPHVNVGVGDLSGECGEGPKVRA